MLNSIKSWQILSFISIISFLYGLFLPFKEIQNNNLIIEQKTGFEIIYEPVIESLNNLLLFRITENTYEFIINYIILFGFILFIISVIILFWSSVSGNELLAIPSSMIYTIILFYFLLSSINGGEIIYNINFGYYLYMSSIISAFCIPILYLHEK